jgi:hypothetical protein
MEAISKENRKENMRTCENCRYRYKNNSCGSHKIDGSTVTYYECRRSPPNENTHFARTILENWCGEWDFEMRNVW